MTPYSSRFITYAPSFKENDDDNQNDNENENKNEIITQIFYGK